MRRFVALLLVAACVVKAVPAEHPAHRRAEAVVDAAAEAAWDAGATAARAAREALRERPSRENGAEDEASRLGGRSALVGGRGAEAPAAGRVAFTGRRGARVDRRADRVAQGAPASAERSVETLAAYLERHAGPTRRGRARAAFRWVADHVAYDTDLGTVERWVRDTQSPGAVLDTREAVCEGYAKLFAALAEEMGLEAAYITGDADPAGSGEGGSHAWNAVKLADGRWYLLDPTWAAGYVTQDRFVEGWEAEWWLTPPQKFGRTHHPDDERWAVE